MTRPYRPAQPWPGAHGHRSSVRKLSIVGSWCSLCQHPGCNWATLRRTWVEALVETRLHTLITTASVASPDPAPARRDEAA